MNNNICTWSFARIPPPLLARLGLSGESALCRAWTRTARGCRGLTNLQKIRYFPQNIKRKLTVSNSEIQEPFVRGLLIYILNFFKKYNTLLPTATVAVETPPAPKPYGQWESLCLSISWNTLFPPQKQSLFIFICLFNILVGCCIVRGSQHQLFKLEILQVGPDRKKTRNVNVYFRFCLKLLLSTPVFPHPRWLAPQTTRLWDGAPAWRGPLHPSPVGKDALWDVPKFSEFPYNFLKKIRTIWITLFRCCWRKGARFRWRRSCPGSPPAWKPWSAHWKQKIKL